MNDINEELKRLHEAINPATNELRLRLNDIILKYDINAPTTLAVLAQLSAGYVHQMKQGQEPAYQDHIEDVFQNMYQESLAQFDLHNINREMEKMRQKELN